jgi:anti-sigma28 factor (negative regulator of flagellin synthesis)
MADHTIDFVFNPDLAAKVPKALQDKIAELKKQIEDGTLVVPKDEF